MPENKDLCPYCPGRAKCQVCGITCKQAGGLTEEGRCAKCAVEYEKLMKWAEEEWRNLQDVIAYRLPIN